MSKSLKKKHTRFTFQSFIRLVIFAVVVFLIISFVSGKKLNSTQIIDKTLSIDEQKTGFVLGKTTEITNNIYQSIPQKSREQLENFNTSSTMIFVQDKINFVKEQTKDFPQKQIKEIQKIVAKSVYENTIRNIESQ